jgi:hypothetical protein
MILARLRHVVAPAVCVALAAACGSGSSHASNGESAKSPTQILKDVRAAVAAAQDVHVSGDVPQAVPAVRLDLRVRHGAGAGSVVLAGNSIQLIRIGDAVYMKAGTKFWEQFGGKNPAVVQLLRDRWIKFPATDSRYAGLAGLLDEQQLMQKVLQPKGRVVKEGTRDYRGQQVIVLRDTADQQGGELYVATTGTPYPVAIVAPGKNAVIRFDSWNQPVKAVAPSDAIDLSKFSS